jgi:Lrp/AsnC family transcriptional regulator for asnA, asnC and gidA
MNMEKFSPQFIATLKRIKGVEEAYALYGVYDVIVRTRAKTMDELKITHDKIRKLDEVRQTLTMIAHEG